MTSLQTDLIVVGGGLAGFACALEAALAGREVVLLEKLEDTGGSSAMSGGCLAFAGTDLQALQGVQDSSEQLEKDLLEVGKFDNDAALVRAYVEHQLDTYRWLCQNGVQFSPSIETSSGQSVPRVHTVDPADMVRTLAARCRQSGRVRVLLGTRAMRLLRDGQEGPVHGITARGPQGALTIAATYGVVLCSGGFAKDAELLHRFAPQYAEAVFVSGEGSTGDGLRMAWRHGADLRDMAYIKGTFGKHPIDTVNSHSCLAVYKGAIAVNQAGNRFVDESLSYKLLGDACMAQPYHAAYQIFDQPIFEAGDDSVRILDFGRRLEEGLLIRADTLDALARQIEIEPEVLQQALARYNDQVDRGVDDDFGRQALVHHHGALQRIETAPFYAYPSTAAVYGTYCGLRVDASMRVIDVFGEAIEGLYAAGEVVGGLHGGAYMTGSALGKAAIFGRIAARSAGARGSAIATPAEAVVT